MPNRKTQTDIRVEITKQPEPTYGDLLRMIPLDGLPEDVANHVDVVMTSPLSSVNVMVPSEVDGDVVQVSVAQLLQVLAEIIAEGTDYLPAIPAEARTSLEWLASCEVASETLLTVQQPHRRFVKALANLLVQDLLRNPPNQCR